MALPRLKPRKELIGSPQPRIAPPTPARSALKDFTATAQSIGLDLWPWQRTAARYLTALGPDGRWLYREVAVIVARQNGKTELLVPLILGRLLTPGTNVMHTAQDGKLPRDVHRRLAALLLANHHELVPAKRGISYALANEEINLTNGSRYRIVAPSNAGARGPSNDLVVIDELREMASFDFIAAAKPTMAARANPQIVYLSNAGSAASEVLNSIRARAGSDQSLAYLEWSAAPDRAPDDPAGWREANPGLGHAPGKRDFLEGEYRAHLLGGSLAVWETEYLCRWTPAMTELLVKAEDWMAQAFGTVDSPLGAVLGVNMDSSGERASAVVAWQGEDEKVRLDVVADVTGHPIDAERLGPDLQRLAIAHRAAIATYDPYTDTDLARHLRRSKAMNGREYANASEKFVRLAQARRFVVRDEANVIGADLAWTTRRAGPSGSFMAVKADDEHTNTAAIAAIRAAWLVSGPRVPAPRIY